MIKLDELTVAYITSTFTEIAQYEIHRTFELFELFGLKYYEDKYVNLLSNENIDNSEKQDMFTSLLVTSGLEITTQHGFKLIPNVSLTQVNEILSALYLIQNLEDYSMIEYRLSSNDDPTKVVADCLAFVTHFEWHDYLRIIESVSEAFLKGLRVFVESKTSDEAYKPDLIHKETVTAYFKFMGDTVVFGAGLLREGFTIDNTLTQLVAMGGMTLPGDLDKLAMSNPVQTAVEIVTFLILAKDTYQIPLVGFNKNTSTFLSKIEDVTKITPIVVKIINDFNSYHFSLKSAEQHQKANTPTPAPAQQTTTPPTQ